MKPPFNAGCHDSFSPVHRQTGQPGDRGVVQSFKTPTEFAKAPLKTLEKYIHSTGFYHNKAKNIKNCSRQILDTHNGRVPQTMAELVKLSGVGRKTANVVLGAASIRRAWWWTPMSPGSPDGWG